MTGVSQYFICLLILLLGLLAYEGDAIKQFPRSQKSYTPHELVDEINANPKAGWKAAVHHRFSNYTLEHSGHFFGGRPTPKHVLASVTNVKHPQFINLPTAFDAREAWPHCKSIGRILDQGHCGSCWAFATVEVLMDRFCIHLNMDVSLSPNNLLACCGGDCGTCEAGYVYKAWEFLGQYGAVSEECDPYFDQEGCNHYNCQPEYPTPRCIKECQTNEAWLDAKHYASESYTINSDPRDIMAELYTNGPVEIIIDAFEDFIFYQSGVYRHTGGKYAGGHIMKIIGWGTTEDGIDYWLAANSWNRNWGEGGYVRILRGANEVGIEAQAWAGWPSTSNLR